MKFHLFTIGYCWHSYFGKSHKIGSHVVDVPSVFILLYGYWMERLGLLVKFTHLRSGLMGRDIGYYNRLPGKGVECLGGHVGRSGACIHDFSTHLMRAPSTEGASSALCPLPCTVSSYNCLCSFRSEDIQLGAYIRSSRYYILVVCLIPSDTCPENEFVFSLL